MSASHKCKTLFSLRSVAHWCWRWYLMFELCFELCICDWLVERALCCLCQSALLSRQRNAGKSWELCVWRIMRDDDQSAQHYQHQHQHQHTSCAHLPSSAQHILQFNWSGCVLCAVFCLYECAHMCVGSVVFMGSTVLCCGRMRGCGGCEEEEEEKERKMKGKMPDREHLFAH